MLTSTETPRPARAVLAIIAAPLLLKLQHLLRLPKLIARVPPTLMEPTQVLYAHLARMAAPRLVELLTQGSLSAPVKMATTAAPHGARLVMPMRQTVQLLQLVLAMRATTLRMEQPRRHARFARSIRTKWLLATGVGICA